MFYYLISGFLFLLTSLEVKGGQLLLIILLSVKYENAIRIQSREEEVAGNVNTLMGSRIQTGSSRKEAMNAPADHPQVPVPPSENKAVWPAVMGRQVTDFPSSRSPSPNSFCLFLSWL